jgi:hypothetical protein
MSGGRADHAPGMRAYLIRLLLEACAVAKNERAGLAAAERALEMGGAACVWEAEVRRLRAEFLASLGATAKDVEAEFERALAVARRQGAKMLELRVATSLLRYRTEPGNDREVSEARKFLVAIVEELPEGRDTPDLREAATLLECE